MKTARLWTVVDIGRYLGLSRSTIYKQIICRPDFPQSVRLTGAHRRWFAEEVQTWVRRQRPRKESA